MKQLTLLISAQCLICFTAFSQAFSYTDPAAAYQRMLLETNDRSTYRQVGTYKVIGTPYLFGDKLKADVFTRTEKAIDASVSFNTHNQELEVYQAGQELPIHVPPAELDSFVLKANAVRGLLTDLRFFHSRFFDSAAKPFFLQLVSAGEHFNLLKVYRSTLGYVSTNYVQADLRQFDLEFDYYYHDSKKGRLRKMKLNANALKKEFKDYGDISTFTDTEEFYKMPEEALKKVFAKLNLH